MLWYSLEAPHSNEYHNICFRGEISKIFCGYSLFSGGMLPVYFPAL